MSPVWVVITGGRYYANAPHVRAVLDSFEKEQHIVCLVQGGAAGADTLAVIWARSKAIPHMTVQADWKNRGPAGGPERNRRMLRMALLCATGWGVAVQVIAFPGGKGTANCVSIAREMDLPVIAAKP